MKRLHTFEERRTGLTFKQENLEPLQKKKTGGEVYMMRLRKVWHNKDARIRSLCKRTLRGSGAGKNISNVLRTVRGATPKVEEGWLGEQRKRLFSLGQYLAEIEYKSEGGKRGAWGRRKTLKIREHNE